MEPTSGAKDVDTAKQEDFYIKISDRVKEWVEKNEEDYEHKNLLKLAPDFFYLLYKASNDVNLKEATRNKLMATIFYFVLPMDVIPEGVVGPEGYADDVVISARVIEEIIEAENEETLSKYWHGDGDLSETIEEVNQKSEQWLGKNKMTQVEEWLEENI